MFEHDQYPTEIPVRMSLVYLEKSNALYPYNGPKHGPLKNRPLSLHGFCSSLTSSVVDAGDNAILYDEHKNNDFCLEIHHFCSPSQLDTVYVFVCVGV